MSSTKSVENGKVLDTALKGYRELLEISYGNAAGSKIARALGKDKGTVSRVLDSLKEKGLIKLKCLVGKEKLYELTVVGKNIVYIIDLFTRSEDDIVNEVESYLAKLATENKTITINVIAAHIGLSPEREDVQQLILGLLKKNGYKTNNHMQTGGISSAIYHKEQT